MFEKLASFRFVLSARCCACLLRMSANVLVVLCRLAAVLVILIIPLCFDSQVFDDATPTALIALQSSPLQSGDAFPAGVTRVTYSATDLVRSLPASFLRLAKAPSCSSYPRR